jgi:ribose transport system ATP-binding protein
MIQAAAMPVARNAGVDGRSVLSFRAMSKMFGANKAVDNVSFDIRPGEILALLGQNGAGKSTLIKMLAGVYAPDAGEIHVAGRPFSPRSNDGTIAFIHQDLGLIEWMTVAENIALAKGYQRRGGLIDWGRTSRAAMDAVRVVVGGIDPDLRIQDLSRTEKSLVAIARAVSADAQVLVLDEPTASLPRQEVERLFSVLRELKSRGTSMIYVSHRLDEVYAISDRLVVLRDGKLVAERRTAEVEPEELIYMIIGRPPETLFVRPESTAQSVMVRFRGVRAGDVGPLDLEIAAGEIVAMVGLRGAGQEEVGRILFGLSPVESGSVVVNGSEPDLASQASAMRAGIGFVAGDRNNESLAHGLSVRENMFLNPGAVGRSMLDWLAPSAEADLSHHLGEDVDLQPNDPHLPIEMLSGGNQQKVVMARWMRIGGKVLVLEDPTAGVDVGAKAEIYRLLADAVGNGLAVILISTDFEEVCQICHRAVVFRNGRIVGSFHHSKLTLEKLVGVASLEAAEAESAPYSVDPSVSV